MDGFSFLRDRAQRLKTMYNTLSILAQLGECEVTCLHLAKNASSQSNLLTLLIQKHVTRFLLSSNTLADLGFNQGGIPSTIRAICNQLGPPRDAKNCDVCTHAG